VEKHGKEAENVMRGRAINVAKKQVQKNMDSNRLKEIIKKRLATKPESKEIEEGKAGRVLGGLALFAALMAGNKALLDADPRMAPLKKAYEQAKKEGKTDRMEKIEDIITRQEVYLSTGQGEEQSLDNIDEKKGKDLNNDSKIDSKDYLLARKAAIEKTKKPMKEEMVDYEGEMAKAELRNLIQNAEEIFDMLDDNTQLEAWVQSKLTKANDYLNSVNQYLKYQSPSNQVDEREFYSLNK
jgi:hypothetical protein